MEVKFDKKCGENEICESELQLEVDPQLNNDSAGNDILEVGGSLEIRVSVKNLGEIAYQTAFYLEKPAELKWQLSTPMNIGCSLSNSTIIECNDIGSKEFGNPLKANTEVSFTLSFGTTYISSDIRNFTLKSWVSTTSQEKTPIRNVVYNRIFVVIKANISVKGFSKPSRVILYKGIVRGESTIKNEIMIGPAISHIYIVENLGQCTVPSSKLTIFWPYELMNKSHLRGKSLLFLIQAPQELDNLTKCYYDPEINSFLGIEDQVPYSSAVNNSKSGTVGRKRWQSEAESGVWSDSGTSNEQMPRAGEAREKNSVKIDCIGGHAKCHQIDCDIGQLEKGQYTQVTLQTRLWDSSFLEDFKDVSKVYIESYAKIFQDKFVSIKQRNRANVIGYATTEAIPVTTFAEKRQVAWWIILLAISGGLLLLILLIVLLWKFGFFRRKRPPVQIISSGEEEERPS